MYDYTLVSALEQMTAAKMLSIVSLNVGRAEPVHGLLQIGLPGTHQQVVMAEKSITL